MAPTRRHRALALISLWALSVPTLGLAAGDESWWEGFHPPGMDATVRCLTSYQDLLIAGGDFTYACDVACGCVVAWNGESWHPLLDTQGRALTGSAGALVVYDGDLIVAGTIYLPGASQSTRIARWRSGEWQPMGGDQFGVAGILALAVYNDELFAGGTFTMVGGLESLGLARWDGAAWQPMPGGGLTDHRVNALLVHDERLIAMGWFGGVGGTSANNVAAWDGSTWSALGSGLDSEVLCGTIYKGALAIGGYFDHANGQVVGLVAHWNGQNWSALGSGLAHPDIWVHPAVYALLEHGGHLIATGSFVGHTGHLATWNGEEWEAFPAGRIDDEGRSLANYAGSLYVGGTFQQAGQQVSSCIARSEGRGWSHLGPSGAGLDGSASILLPTADGLYVSGGFRSAGSEQQTGLAFWDGETWTPLPNPDDSDYEDYVLALALFQGELIAGGEFAMYSGGAEFNNITRWNGSSWQPLGESPDGWVRALAADGGRLIVGGEFTHLGALYANYIAAWDGHVWSPLGIGLNGPVHAILADGGHVYAGGAFSQAGGQAASRIAVWDGLSWAALGSGLNGPVWALARHGEQIIAGGTFTYAGTAAVNRIAAWDGAGWQPMAAGFNDWVFDLASLDGVLYAGGKYHRSGNMDVDLVARWDGAAWLPLGSGLSFEYQFDGSVSALAAFEGQLFAGGSFKYAGGKPSFYLARWDAVAVSVDDPIQAGPASLGPNYPNPFNPVTWIPFALERAAQVRLSVHEVSGRELTVLVDARFPAGNHLQQWDGRDEQGRTVPSGVYVVRFDAAGVVSSRKLVLVR